MDPLTAIGFVSNIISFVDFGLKLLSKTREIVRSADGATSANYDLELITADLQSLTDRLGDGVSQRVTQPPQEKNLGDVRDGCAQVAKELLNLLDQLKVKGEKTAYKSFRQAIKIIFKKDVLEDLVRRLSIYREQLDTHLLVDLRLQVDRLSIQNTESYQKLSKRTQLIFNAILATDRNVSDIAKLQDEQLVSFHKTTLVHIDGHHTQIKDRVDNAAVSIQQHTTDEHEVTRSQFLTQAQGVLRLEEGVQTVLVETRENAVGTSNAWQETGEVLLENSAALKALSKNVTDFGAHLELIARTLQSQMQPQNGILLYKTPYVIGQAPQKSTSRESHSRRKLSRSNPSRSMISPRATKSSKRFEAPIPQTIVKLKWQKHFKTLTGSVMIRSDVVIKEGSSFVRIRFTFIPTLWSSNTISTYETHTGAGIFPSYSMRMFNIRPCAAAIFQACQRDSDSRTLRYLLQTGEGSPFDITPSGRTPLHEAVYNGRYDLCEILIRHGAPVDTDYWGLGTPLSQYNCVDRFCDPRILRLLLAKGACPSQIDSNGMDFWFPAVNARFLSVEELQIVAPYRQIDECNDEVWPKFDAIMPLGICNIYMGSRSGTLTVEILDDLAKLNMKFGKECIYRGWKMNIHHLVLSGFSWPYTPTERHVMVSVLSKLLQLYPDKTARGPQKEGGIGWATTTSFAKFQNMLDIWLEALIASGEGDIDEFVRADNQLILQRGGGTDELSYDSYRGLQMADYIYTRHREGPGWKREEILETSDSDDSDGDPYGSESDVDSSDSDEPDDIFGEALRSEWEIQDIIFLELD